MIMIRKNVLDAIDSIGLRLRPTKNFDGKNIFRGGNGFEACDSATERRLNDGSRNLILSNLT
jgi:hypothetical protein